jgi:hypothetical protein
VSDVSLLSQEIVGRNEVREEKALPICRSGANLVNMMDLRRRSSVNNANSHLGHASHAPTVECAVPSSCDGGRNSLGRFGAKPGGRSCTDGERFDAALRRATVCLANATGRFGSRSCENTMLFQIAGSSDPSPSENNRIQSVLRGRYFARSLPNLFSHGLGR